jgi:hypothetical protein
MENIAQELKSFNNSFFTNFNVFCSISEYKGPSQDELSFLETVKKSVQQGIHQLYTQLGTYKLSWQNAVELPEDVTGSVNIISIKTVMSDWRNIIYFEDESPLLNFKVIDQFANEACCGFYTTGEQVSSGELIYFYNYSDNPVALQLTPQEYVLMLIEAKGYRYWQKVLMDYNSGVQSPYTVSMQTYLPVLFPDFSFEAFIKKYESLK